MEINVDNNSIWLLEDDVVKVTGVAIARPPYNILVHGPRQHGKSAMFSVTFRNSNGTLYTLPLATFKHIAKPTERPYIHTAGLQGLVLEVLPNGVHTVSYKRTDGEIRTLIYRTGDGLPVKITAKPYKVIFVDSESNLHDGEDTFVLAVLAEQIYPECGTAVKVIKITDMSQLN